MQHVCAVPEGLPPPPSPLLGNLGAGMGAIHTTFDPQAWQFPSVISNSSAQMLTMVGGKARTYEEFISLGLGCRSRLEAGSNEARPPEHDCVRSRIAE